MPLAKVPRVLSCPDNRTEILLLKVIQMQELQRLPNQTLAASNIFPLVPKAWQQSCAIHNLLVVEIKLYQYRRKFPR